MDDIHGAPLVPFDEDALSRGVAPLDQHPDQAIELGVVEPSKERRRDEETL